MKLVFTILFLFPFMAFSKEESKIRFGLNAFMPPYVIVDGEDFSGVSVEILEAVFVRAKLNYMLEAVSNRRINELFVSGDFTGALYLSDIKNLPIPVYFGPELIAFQNGFMCIELENCEKASVLGNDLKMAGFQNASKGMGDKFNRLAKSMKNYSELTNQKEQIMGLFSRRFDVVFGDERVLRYHIRHISQSSHLYSKKIKETKFFHKLYHHQTRRKIAFANREHRDIFVKAYSDLKKEGALDKIIQKYVNE